MAVERRGCCTSVLWDLPLTRSIHTAGQPAVSLVKAVSFACHLATAQCLRVPLRSGTWLARGAASCTGLRLSRKQCQLALDSGFSNLLTVIFRVMIGSMKAEGTVYLLHFERPYNGRSQHYLGFTRNDLEQHLDRSCCSSV
jgi:hypothetical protein